MLSSTCYAKARWNVTWLLTQTACRPCDADHDYSILFLDGPATPFTLPVGYNDSLDG